MWITECQPTDSYSAALILGRELYMAHEQWQYQKCSLNGKCLFFAACGHTKNGTERKIRKDKQTGFKIIREIEEPEEPDKLEENEQENGGFQPLTSRRLCI